MGMSAIIQAVIGQQFPLQANREQTPELNLFFLKYSQTIHPFIFSSMTARDVTNAILFPDGLEFVGLL